jgi:hypothetical protein
MAYETGWTPIIEFQEGAVVSQKFDNAFSKIDTALVAYEATEAQVNTNVSDISTLQSSAVNQSQRISALENVQYEFIKVKDLDISQDTFAPVATVTIDNMNAGIFEYKVSVLFKYSSTSSSAIFRYAIIRNDDANPTWYEIYEEPKDVTNNNSMDLFFPIEETGGEKVTLALEARCEDASQTLSIQFADLMIDQKK